MKAKKSLGQNFLKSRAALAAILRAAEVAAGSTVLEIGPGKGVLTEELLKAVGAKGRVIAVEKDARMVEFLHEKHAKEIAQNRLTLIHDDILTCDLKKHIPRGAPYTLVANIPYYITGQIFRMFLQSASQPQKMVLLVQKEVAKRIVAADGKESILSVSVKIFGTPKYIETVSARYFSPAPKVDSAILLVKDIKNPFADTREAQAFFETLRRGFASKRKFLKRNLGIEEQEMRACGVAPTARAEDLSVSDWLCVSKTHAKN